ncbi:MAG: hypothetical protein OXF74_02505 [Rhodobacteraceae bacterium]|nr:hypothetical protein [Paracoccaceae bacterium]
MAGSVADRIRLESIGDERVLVLKDGSFASMIRIEGAMRHEDAAEFAIVTDALRVSLAPALSQPGHAVEIYFSRDPEAAPRRIFRFAERKRQRAEELRLALGDILQGADRRLAAHLVDESCLAVIYSRPLADGQPDWNEILARHATLTDACCRDLNNCGRVADILSAEDALRRIRAALYPCEAAWKPARDPLAGNVFPLMANLHPPALDRQLATEDAYVVDSRTVRLGDTIFAGFDVTVAPEILTSFNLLVESVTDLPWRCRWLVEPGGLQAVRLKEQYARLFAFAAPVRNPRIRDAIVRLREIDGAGDTVARLRISFATWAAADRPAELQHRYAALKRASEQWGNLSADSVTGDPLAMILSSVVGLGPESTAPCAAAPLADILTMLPLARQASPWPEGPVIFRTGDGKAWPYRPGSSRQNSWVEIYCGSSGSGKSVAMHAVNLASALESHGLDEGDAELPQIAIVDIGCSARGFVELIRNALPPRRRGEASQLKLRMTPEHAINPFDTEPGMRHPMAAGRAFMINFLSLLIGAGERGCCPLAGLAAAALDTAFECLSDSGDPKRYIRSDDLFVDRALAAIGRQPAELASWWEVADALFAAGEFDAAARAQRRAMPVLTDLVAASHVDHITSLYANTLTEAGDEPVLKAFQRRIAETIREFPIMTCATIFDAGQARITAIDLEEVAGSHDMPGAPRQAALMYMLARQFLIGHWLVDEEEIANALLGGKCPRQYERFHRMRARTARRLPKLLCIDEFHRAGSLPGFRRQILQDIREGRKHNIRTALASQLPEDFGVEILDAASTIFIFDAPASTSVKWFGLTEAELELLHRKLTGPTRDGAPCFARIRHKRGTARQLLYLTLSAAELWALSTTSVDTALRDAVAAQLSPAETRAALAAMFPSGSAKEEIESMAARLTERDGGSGNVVERLASEAVERFRHRGLSDETPL